MRLYLEVESDQTSWSAALFKRELPAGPMTLGVVSDTNKQLEGKYSQGLRIDVCIKLQLLCVFNFISFINILQFNRHFLIFSFRNYTVLFYFVLIRPNFKLFPVNLKSEIAYDNIDTICNCILLHFLLLLIHHKFLRYFWIWVIVWLLYLITFQP